MKVELRSRTRLPNRRPTITETLFVGGQAIEASVGFDPATGQPRELFLSGVKDATDLAAILDDTSVALSAVLQSQRFTVRPSPTGAIVTRTA